MKILLLSHKIPYPLHDGGSLSIYYTVLGLIDNGCDVTLFAIETPSQRTDVSLITRTFRDNIGFCFSRVDTRIRPIRAFLNLFSNRSYFVERFYSESFSHELTRLIRQSHFNIIQLEHSYMCVYLKTIRAATDAKIILRPQNVENMLWGRTLKHEKNVLKRLFLSVANSRLEKFEKEISRQVDGIIAIADHDRAEFARYAPDIPAISIPFGLDLTKTDQIDFEKQFKDFPALYHIGSMDWKPNLQGMDWFLENVFPSLTQRFPGLKFFMAGKSMPQRYFRINNTNLEIAGEVDNAITFQEDKAIMIVPLLAGGGIRVKIIQAMAMGKTVISTAIGAEGIPYSEGENILIANNKDEFLGKIGMCIQSPTLCRHIGRQAQKLVAEHFDYLKNGEKMVGFYLK